MNETSSLPPQNNAPLWFYANATNQPIGPITFSELTRLATTGVISPNAYVIEEGKAEWRPFSEIHAARNIRRQAPLPPPPTPQSQAKSSKSPPRWLAILFLIIFFPIGLVLLWLSNFKKPTKIIVTSIFALLFFVGLFSDKHSRDESSPSTTSSEAGEHSPISSNISWQEVDEIYNIKSKTTNLRKEESWSRFEGKRVTWSGEVSSISDGFGGLTMQVKMNPDTFVSDLLVNLKRSEHQKAARLSKGDQVTFTARLVNWGSLLPITLDEGEIR